MYCILKLRGNFKPSTNTQTYMTKTKLISLITILFALAGCIYALTSTSETITPQVNSQAQAETKQVSELTTEAQTPVIDNSSKIADIVNHDNNQTQETEKPTPRATQATPDLSIQKVKPANQKAQTPKVQKSISQGVNQSSVPVKQEAKEAKGGFKTPTLPKTMPEGQTCATREQNGESGESYCV
jgi:hypothetical protein